MASAASVIKYLLFIFNVIFALIGFVLVGLGTAGILKVEAIVNIFRGDSLVLPILAIVLGSLVFFIAFFGCCGAIIESFCMLITFSIIMILLIIVKIALVIALFAGKELLAKMIDSISERNSALLAATVYEMVYEERTIICGICSGIGFLELIGLIFGCYLANHMRNKSRGTLRGHRSNAMMMY